MRNYTYRQNHHPASFCITIVPARITSFIIFSSYLLSYGRCKENDDHFEIAREKRSEEVAKTSVNQELESTFTLITAKVLQQLGHDHPFFRENTTHLHPLFKLLHQLHNPFLCQKTQLCHLFVVIYQLDGVKYQH